LPEAGNVPGVQGFSHQHPTSQVPENPPRCIFVWNPPMSNWEVPRSVRSFASLNFISHEVKGTQHRLKWICTKYVPYKPARSIYLQRLKLTSGIIHEVVLLLSHLQQSLQPDQPPLRPAHHPRALSSHARQSLPPTHAL
jgi:hypothetical protein